MIEVSKKNKEKNEITMRILANHIIDRFLEKIANDRLQSALKENNISLEQKRDYGTH